MDSIALITVGLTNKYMCVYIVPSMHARTHRRMIQAPGEQKASENEFKSVDQSTVMVYESAPSKSHILIISLFRARNENHA